jgi:hypothetical protein
MSFRLSSDVPGERALLYVLSIHPSIEDENGDRLDKADGHVIYLRYCAGISGAYGKHPVEVQTCRING